jgi:hypothetical protein
MDPLQGLKVSMETFAAHLCIDNEGLKFGDHIPEVAKLTSVRKQVCSLAVGVNEYSQSNLLHFNSVAFFSPNLSLNK